MPQSVNQPRGVRTTTWPPKSVRTPTHEGETRPADQEQSKDPISGAPRRELLMSLFAVVVALAILLAALSTRTDPATQQQQIDQAVARALASATPPPPIAVTVYHAIQPSLVEIMAQVQDENGDPALSYGTGFIVNDKGMILTSLHIVKGSSGIKVTFADGTESEAQIIKQMQDHDLAFVQPLDPPQQVQPATLGNPHALQVGDQAIVVGNPMRLADSLTTGSISGLERVFNSPDGNAPMTGMIQIDAAVNPGNSGGPLLNRKGEVVGIITGRASPSGDQPFIGIGFAVPIDVALSVNGPPPY